MSAAVEVQNAAAGEVNEESGAAEKEEKEEEEEAVTCDNFPRCGVA